MLLFLQKNGHLLLLLGCSLVLGASCAVGPEYRRPELGLPDAWTRSLEADACAKRASTEVWWDCFADKDLKRLIARVRQANPDLHRSRARIDEAWAQRHVHVAGGLPHLDASTRIDWGLGDYDSANGFQFAKGENHQQFHQADLGWEIDLFGRRQRMVEGSTRHWEATIEAWRDTLLFLTGEVALHYTDVRVNEARIGLLKENIGVYREILETTEAKEAEGVESKTAVREARARLLAWESELPQIELQIVLAKNQLARLLAVYPGEISSMLSPGLPVPSPPRSIGAAVPAQSIRSRPDVRVAEREMASQVAEVGLAIAEVYPYFNLSGALTYDLIHNGGSTAAFLRTLGGGFTLTKRLFHGGADQAKVAEQNALLQQATRTYEAAVLRAVSETESALAELSLGRQRFAKLKEATAATDEAYDSLRSAYDDSLIDVRDLLRAQEQRHAVRLEYLFARNLLAKASVRLFKATGGGTLPAPPAETPKNLDPTIQPKGSGILSHLFSLGGDPEATLHRRISSNDGRRGRFGRRR